MSETSGAVGVDKSRELKLRVASALVIAPAALLLTWFGGVAFSLLAIAVAVVMVDEWTTIVLGPSRAPDRLAALGLAALAAATAIFGGRLGLQPSANMLIVVISLGLSAGLTMRAARLSGLGPQAVSWAPWGAFYSVLPCLALDSLRSSPMGLWLVFFVFAVVWATDIAAYFTGRTIGGPKLWPAVSPKKTWSGAVGGLVVAVLAGTAVAHFAGAPRLVPVMLVAAALSVASQGGDLLESALKRKFDVKDSGRLIPGHGGLLDRVDGLVAAAVVAILIAILHGGGQAVGSSGLVMW
jgi:phosphatidate cytidylyltransferase